jgi:hypothetical protein
LRSKQSTIQGSGHRGKAISQKPDPHKPVLKSTPQRALGSTGGWGRLLAPHRQVRRLPSIIADTAQCHSPSALPRASGLVLCRNDGHHPSARSSGGRDPGGIPPLSSANAGVWHCREDTVGSQAATKSVARSDLLLGLGSLGVRGFPKYPEISVSTRSQKRPVTS